MVYIWRTVVGVENCESSVLKKKERVPRIQCLYSWRAIFEVGPAADKQIVAGEGSSRTMISHWSGAHELG